MFALVDNDIALKLAQCDLIDELPNVLGESPEHYFITPNARFQLLPRPKERGINRCGNEESYYRLTSFIEQATELPPVDDLDRLEALSNIPGIDSGEALLFASMCEYENAILLTGDKRALEALQEHGDSFPEILDVVTESVVNFETALLLAWNEIGYPTLKQKLLGNPRPDGVLRTVLGESMTEQSLQDCLCSYTRHLSEFLAFKDRLPPELE